MLRYIRLETGFHFRLINSPNVARKWVEAAEHLEDDDAQAVDVAGNSQMKLI